MLGEPSLITGVVYGGTSAIEPLLQPLHAGELTLEDQKDTRILKSSVVSGENSQFLRRKMSNEPCTADGYSTSFRT